MCREARRATEEQKSLPFRIIFMKIKKIKKITLYFAKNIFIILGVVLIWRGIWYALDSFDKLVFGGSHFWTALGGITVGLLLLYLPDRDLKEIEQL